ncbi:MAG: hypothetical protein WAT71_01700 [Ignavibacteria bacterium]
MKKKIGVWLDHSKAKLIEIMEGGSEITTVHSPYKRRIRIPGESSSNVQTRFGKRYFSNTDFKIHQKKQNDKNVYFKDLEKRLQKYDMILLFGPTLAKTELSNFLSEKKLFASKSIVQKNSDKMTENEMVALVRKYFEKN